MKYKVAIQFLKEIIGTFKCISDTIGHYKGSDVDKKTLAIISLLEQGEKYEQMWKEFKKEYGVEYIEFEGGDDVAEAMEKFEQKYSPK